MDADANPQRLSISLVGGLSLYAALVWIGFRQDGDRGRARSPERDEAEGDQGTSPAPQRGWLDVAKRVYERFNEDRVMAIAGGVTFFSLLAIFPAIAALVSIYGLFSDPSDLTSQVNALEQFLPEGAITIVSEQMHKVASGGGTALGVTFFVSLAASLWSANAGAKALFDALNIVYDETETRGFIRLNAVSLALTFAGIALTAVAFAGVVALPVALGYVGLEDPARQAIDLGRWPLLLLVIALALAAIYRFGPSRKNAKWRWISWGSVAASLLWLGSSALFSWYAANFGNFNATYGTLGAVVGFMFWIWISAIVILVGAELDAELESQEPSTRKLRSGGFVPRTGPDGRRGLEKQAT